MAVGDGLVAMLVRCWLGGVGCGDLGRGGLGGGGLGLSPWQFSRLVGAVSFRWMLGGVMVLTMLVISTMMMLVAVVEVVVVGREIYVKDLKVRSIVDLSVSDLCG